MSLNSTPLIYVGHERGNAMSVNELYSGSTVCGGASVEIVRALILQEPKTLRLRVSGEVSRTAVSARASVITTLG
jgi:hypothetical protein